MAVDLEQCKCALRAGPDGVEFLCTEAAMHCATHRLTRFSPCLIPPCEVREENGVRVLSLSSSTLGKLRDRIRKYVQRGFRVESPDDMVPM